MANLIAPFGDFPAQAAVVLLNVSNVARASGFELGFLGHAWSLSMEEQFYLVWPVILLLTPRRAVLPVLLVGITLAIAAQGAYAQDPNASYRPDVRADAILWGCALAVTRWRASLAFAAIGTIASATLVIAGAATEFAFIAVASAVVVAGADRLPFVRAPILVRVGKISYGHAAT